MTSARQDPADWQMELNAAFVAAEDLLGGERSRNFLLSYVAEQMDADVEEVMHALEVCGNRKEL